MVVAELELQELAGALERRIPELADRMVQRMCGEIPEFRNLDSVELRRTLADGSRRAFESELGYMRHGGRLPETCPPEAADAARLAAAARLPLTVVLQTHRVGHAVAWEACVEESEALDLDGPARRALLDAASRFFFAYVDRLARFAEAEYAEEVDRLHRNRDPQRLGIVLELLDGSASELPADAAYDLRLEHVAVVASSPAAGDAVRALGRLLDRRTFTVAAEGAVWAWLGGREPLDPVMLARTARFDAGGAVVGLGEPAAGVDGFRRSHRQADHAHHAALRRGVPVARYRDVALEALALADERAAREFVEHELAALGNSARAETLRETLRAYFECSQNAAASAAALGVHEQTVAQRLRAVEELIGEPVNARRAALEAALRVEPLLRSPT